LHIEEALELVALAFTTVVSIAVRPYAVAFIVVQPYAVEWR
jgi:flagellar assembly factor FliW